MNNRKLEAKRITRWLLSAEISAEMIDNKLVATAHDDNTEYGKYITNLKWCIREVRRIRDRGGNAYTKKVGDYCAVYANITTKEANEIKDLEITIDDVKEMIEADNRKAA